MVYFTYILYSALRDKYYIGFTGDDLQTRVRKHNTNHKGFTGHVNDWELVYFEEFPYKELAVRRELEIKGWKSRNKIERLVGLDHPDL